MENKTRKKRSSGAPAKVKRDPVKSGRSSRSATGMVIKKSPDETVRSGPPPNVLGITLDPESARQAVILSEIIGKPVSKRGKRR